MAELELDAHHLDGDDSVVNEQTERDNERPERDLVQVDAEHVHEDEDAAEHERDAARDDEARAQAEREEAHAEHDDDGLEQRLDEVMNRVLDDARLVGNLVDLEADGQILLDGRDFFLEVLAELEHVAAVLHRDGDADGALAIEIHARLRGLDGAALDLRDVAEAENLAICVDGQRLDVLDIVKRARDAQVDVVGSRFELARRRHLVLRLERLQDGIRAHAELHEFRSLSLDVDLFFLHALELDFLDVRHLHEQAACILGRAAHFFITVAVARHGIDRAIDVVKAVVVIWPIDAVRQLALLVLAEIAHVAPRLANLRLVHVVGEVDVDDRLARARLAVDVIEARRVLELLFELVRDLVLHLVG